MQGNNRTPPPFSNDPGKKGIRDGQDNISIRSHIQIFAPQGVTCPSQPDVINNFSHSVRDFLTHGKKISTTSPQMNGLSNKKESAFYSIFNSIDGNNTEFHITLHWMLGTQKINQVFAKMTSNNTFANFIQNLNQETDQSWTELKQSLTDLLA